MSKARTPPSAKTGIVLKISIALVILLAIVLYKLDDYFKQEKWQLSQSQLRTQIVSVKTSVSSQISALKNVLSSYENELVEGKINWVQLDPFFGIAAAQRTGSTGGVAYKVTQFIGRSGSAGERWNAAYLDRALSLQNSTSDQPITIQLFQDKAGAKYLAVRFANNSGRAVVVVGAADYFQKFFDLDRGGRITSLLKTTDHVLAAHSEADYVATLTEEESLSPKKYLIEKEEIAGTNLVAMSYVLKKALASGFAVPWSVVGLIIGFGFMIIGFLFYYLDPLEKRIDRYKKLEREEIFNKTLDQAKAKAAAATETIVTEKPQTTNDLVKSMVESEEKKNEMSAEIDVSVDAVATSSEPSSAPSEINVPHLFDLNLIQKNSAASKPGEVFFEDLEAENEMVNSENELRLSEDGEQVVQDDNLDESSDGDESDNLDLDKVLSLDDLDNDISAQETIQTIQAGLTSNKINTTGQITEQMTEVVNPQTSNNYELKKPDFFVTKKDFKVDSIAVKMRRPDKS